MFVLALILILLGIAGLFVSLALHKKVKNMMSAESLRERWAEEGVIVEEVTLQEIRYSSEVTARFDDAQASRIAVDRAEAEIESLEVEYTRALQDMGTCPTCLQKVS